jgi:DNA-binding XRE family transcriptional regulator
MMHTSEFLEWRKMLGYTQEEAGAKLGVSRATIQNWENGVTRIPKAAELACVRLTRRWKQRPEFGPVAVVYTDGPNWKDLKHSYCLATLQCEVHQNNETALERACKLYEAPHFSYCFIMEEDGQIVWDGLELARECNQRKQKAAPGDSQPMAAR